jgi:carboxymethylenebutenolidase
MAEWNLRCEELTFVREGEPLRGFACWPARHERMPAIIVVHDVHGLSDHYRDIARRFASEGFFAFAVDLYSREGSPRLRSPEEVRSWLQKLDDRRVLADLQTAIRFLGSRLEVRSSAIGIVGFCMGGQYALLAACRLEGLAACVSFYGMLRYAEKSERKPLSPLEAAADLRCPFLGLYGEEDALIPLSDVREFEETLKRANKTFAIKTYRKAGHAFFNDTRPDAYRPEAAKDAWRRCIEFFREHLR